MARENLKAAMASLSFSVRTLTSQVKSTTRVDMFTKTASFKVNHRTSIAAVIVVIA